MLILRTDRIEKMKLTDEFIKEEPEEAAELIALYNKMNSYEWVNNRIPLQEKLLAMFELCYLINVLANGPYLEIYVVEFPDTDVVYIGGTHAHWDIFRDFGYARC